jgi:Na+/H+ antiporter NhaC
LGGVVFLLASLISFATGTSWGTFSIMIPVAVPMAVALDANVALAIGAVISGGVFGDHCSPISDTTIISSLAAECDVVEHVNTQLPYALLSAGIALIGFFIFSIS